MRQFRTIYSAPCCTDRRNKLSYVHGRIHVRVPLGSARTGKAMLHPFSDSPTHRARLVGLGFIPLTFVVGFLIGGFRRRNA